MLHNVRSLSHNMMHIMCKLFENVPTALANSETEAWPWPWLRCGGFEGWEEDTLCPPSSEFLNMVAAHCRQGGGK